MPASICFVGHLMLPLLTGGPDALVGGAEVQSLHLAEELRHRGWSLSFLTCGLYGSQTRDQETRLGPAHLLYTRRGSRRSVLDKLREKTATFGAVRSHEADFFFQRAVWDADVCALAARSTGRPFVYGLASDRDAFDLPFGSRRRNVLRLATTVVAQSDAQRTAVAGYGHPATTIPSGFPVPSWPQDKKDEILWVGTLRALKRPELFLDLAESLPKLRFVLCGGPGEDTRLAQRVTRRAAGLANVRFEGFVPYARIHPYFARARVVVNTSTYEGFPNTFALAWLFGAVVLSLDVDPDAVLSKQGLGVHAGATTALRDALEHLSTHETHRSGIAERARRVAEEKHDIRHVASQYEELFRKILRQA